MAQREWDENLEDLLKQVAEIVRNGLPAEGVYLPAWRWQLDSFVMHPLTNGYDYDGYQETARRYIADHGRPLPEISMGELPVLAILEHGVCRPVLTDGQVIRLAFSPDTVEMLREEMIKVGTEWGDMWNAVSLTRLVELPPRPAKSKEQLWEDFQRILKRAEEQEQAEPAHDEDDDAEDGTDSDAPK